MASPEFSRWRYLDYKDGGATPLSDYFLGEITPIERSEELRKQPIPEVPSHLPPPDLTSNAIHVLERRYLRRIDGGLETPQAMLWRVAFTAAKTEGLYSNGENAEVVTATAERFYEMMAELKFLPNSPTLMNAGKPLGQLSACFVLPVGDSMEEIFDAVKWTALIHQSGGGTGFSFSRLREAGAEVRTTGREASGPLSFMKVFDTATETIIQGGMRRGANMGILRVDHPDIKSFIAAKGKPGQFGNFNLSVALTDDFMAAAKEGGDYPLISPLDGREVKRLNAQAVLDSIAQRAHERGDPGVIFIDKMNEGNPTPLLGEIESTNPCGEQPLLPFESCNLGSINLGKFVENNQIDWDDLRETVHLAVRFLDNVIDVNRYPLEKIRMMTLGNRKIGLGIMGLADMLIKLRVPYGSEEGIEITGRVMEFIRDEGRKVSMALAKARGVFPNYQGSTYEAMDMPMRNATVITIAPTGSISLIAGCNSGGEPPYGLAYNRHTRLGETAKDNVLWEVNALFQEATTTEGLDEETVRAIIKRGKIVDGDKVPEWMKSVFATAPQIPAVGHLLMQAALQKYTDNAVSKTINFPHQTTWEEIRDAYLMAYNLGLKGLTVYRDGSRDQVLVAGEGKKEEVSEVHSRRPRPRSMLTQGTTEKIEVGCGQRIYVTVNQDENGLFEVFINMGKSGGCISSQSEAVGRLISLALRSGVEPQSIVQQLTGIRCPTPAWREGGPLLSCADAVGQAIKRYLTKNGLTSIPPTVVEQPPMVDKLSGMCPECPDCGTMVEFVEGCLRCPSCGYGQCS